MALVSNTPSPSSLLHVGAVLVETSSLAVDDALVVVAAAAVSVFVVLSLALLGAPWCLVGALLLSLNQLSLVLWPLVHCRVFDWVVPMLVVPHLLAVVVVVVVPVVLPALSLCCTICKDNGCSQHHTAAWFHSSRLYILRKNVHHYLWAAFQRV